MPVQRKALKEPHYLTDEKGKRVAVQLDIETYNKLIEELDELGCIAAYDEAKRQKPDYLPYDEAMKEIKAARKRKGLK